MCRTRLEIGLVLDVVGSCDWSVSICVGEEYRTLFGIDPVPRL